MQLTLGPDSQTSEPVETVTLVGYLAKVVTGLLAPISQDGYSSFAIRE